MPSWSHLGPVLGARMAISCGRGCFFQHIAFSVLRSPKIAQDGPRWAKMDPTWAQHGPKMTPRCPQDGPKTVPRRFRDASLTKPKISYLSLCSDNSGGSPQMLPRGSQEAPKNRPRGPKTPPRGPKSTPRDPQGAPKRPQEAPRGPQEPLQEVPRGPQEAPSSLWRSALHVEGVAFLICHTKLRAICRR